MEIIQKKIMTGRSKAAGILKRAPNPNKTPAQKIVMFLRSFLRRNIKAIIVNTIIKSSELTVSPSRRGSVVSSPKIRVDSF